MHALHDHVRGVGLQVDLERLHHALGADRALELGEAPQAVHGLRSACELDRHRHERALGLDHRFEVALRRNRKSRLNDVHIEGFELVRHSQLLVDIHAETGSLLAIAKSGVEYRAPRHSLLLAAGGEIKSGLLRFEKARLSAFQCFSFFAPAARTRLPSWGQ